MVTRVRDPSAAASSSPACFWHTHHDTTNPAAERPTGLYAYRTDLVCGGSQSLVSLVDLGVVGRDSS